MPSLVTPRRRKGPPALTPFSFAYSSYSHFLSLLLSLLLFSLPPTLLTPPFSTPPPPTITEQSSLPSRSRLPSSAPSPRVRNGQARSPLCALAGGRSGWYSWKKKTKDSQNLGSVSSFGFEKRVEIVIIRKILLGGKGRNS